MDLTSYKILKAPTEDLMKDCEPRILVTGCFDVIHAGHIQLLEHARLLGDLGQETWVGLNSDAAIRTLKGPTRPINTYRHRALVMSAILYVDYVFEIDDVRVDSAIRLIKPEIWLKGGDYTLDTLDKGEVEAAKEVGARIAIFRSEYDISTTKIVKQMETQ